jgi:hypothetical protein
MSWPIITTPFVTLLSSLSIQQATDIKFLQDHTITSASLTTSVIRPRKRTNLPSLSSSLSRVRFCLLFKHHTLLILWISLGWKRLLLADGPRQTINALTLYSIYLAKKNDGQWYDVPKYFRGNSLSTSALTATTFFTFVIFVGSALLLVIAGIFYIPLLCYIQGNLKVRNNNHFNAEIHNC